MKARMIPMMLVFGGTSRTIMRLILAGVILAVAVAAAVGTRAQDDLPPEVRFDILKLELSNASRDGRHKEVLAIAQQMRGLGQAMPPEAAFVEAQAFHALGALDMARRSLSAYLKQVGRGGSRYDQALRLYVSIKADLDAQARAEAARERLRAAWEAAHAAWRTDREQAETWKKRAVVFGGPGEDSAAAIARTPDGGIVVAGAFHVRNDSGKPINLTLPWITAFDARGRRIWHHPLGSAEHAGSLRSAVAVPGRGYLFGGMQKGFQIAAVTDLFGNAVENGEGDPWIMAFGPAPGGEGGLARLLPDGDVIAVGAEEVGKDNGAGKGATRLPVSVRLAPDGTLRGKAVFGRTAGTLWYDVKDALVLPGGDVIVAGETRRDSASAATAEGYLLRFSAEGRELWLRRVASDDGSAMALTAIAARRGGGAIVTGRDGHALVWLAIDGDGNVLWRKRRTGNAVIPGTEALCAEKAPAEALADAYRERDGNAMAATVARDANAVVAFACWRGRPFAAGTAIVPTADGYIVLGIAGHEGEASTRITLTAMDERGEVLWERRHGDEGTSLATAALPTADGGLVVGGVTTSWGRDVALFRTDSEGGLRAFSDLAPPASKGKAAPPAEPISAPGTDSRPRVMPETPQAPQREAASPGKGLTEAEPAAEHSGGEAEIDLFELLGDIFSDPSADDPGPQRNP